MKSVHPLFSWNFYGIISISFYGRRGLYSTINKTDAFAAPGCCLLTGGMTMDFKNKKTTIALIVCAVILALIGWRVWANIQAKKAEANRSGKEKVAVVTAAYPERKTIVPKFRFSGTLDPVWQADVAAKVDGRIEQVLVNEGDAVSAGEVLAILDRTDTDASLLNAKGLYADAKTDYEKAQADLARYTKLYAAGAISKESLDNKQFALENAKGKLDVGGALGVGVLSVIQDIGLKEPYVGQTILVTGEIAEDLTYYYATSEQTPSSVALGVLMNKENTVRQAGGFIIQLLPGAEEATIAALEKTIGELEPVTTMLNKGMTPEDILELILGQFGLEILDKMPIQFTCNCTKSRVEKALISIGGKELQEMIDEGKSIEVNCQFCNKHYEFSVDELKKLYEKAKK